MRDLQLDPARGISFDHVDKVPRDTARRYFTEQNVQGVLGGDSAEKTPYGAARPNVHRMNAQHRKRSVPFLAGLEFQVDVVHANNFSPVDVDDLLIEKIAFQQKVAFHSIRQRPLARSGGRSNATRDPQNRLKRHDSISGFCLDDERRDPGTVLLRSECNFAHASSRARRVIHGGAEQFG